MDQDLSLLTALILCDGSDCDKMGDYLTTEADTMIDTVCEVDFNKCLF